MIEIMSMWRNDADRDLEGRMDHLLHKWSALHELRWLWMTGDNDDDTAARLRRLVRMRYHGHMDTCPVTIVAADTGIVGEDLATRRRRSSAAATEMFRHVDAGATFVVLHESDLVTPFDIVDQLLLSGNGEPTAGWPTIEIVEGHLQFYDVWAFRDLRGKMFGPRSQLRERKEVSSFGSCWIAPAPMVRDRVITDTCIVELCKQWTDEGIRLYVDPTIEVEQPVDRWEPLP